MAHQDEGAMEEPGERKERNKLGPQEQRQSLEDDVRRRIAAVKKAIDKTQGIANALDKKLLDPLIGLLFPEAGDVVTGAVAMWIVVEGMKAGLPAKKIAKMLFNVGFDIGVGMIPALGDIADFFIHANTRNVDIMKDHLAELNAKHHTITGKSAEEALQEMRTASRN